MRRGSVSNLWCFVMLGEYTFPSLRLSLSPFSVVVDWLESVEASEVEDPPCWFSVMLKVTLGPEDAAKIIARSWGQRSGRRGWWDWPCPEMMAKTLGSLMLRCIGMLEPEVRVEEEVCEEREAASMEMLLLKEAMLSRGLPDEVKASPLGMLLGWVWLVGVSFFSPVRRFLFSRMMDMSGRYREAILACWDCDQREWRVRIKIGRYSIRWVMSGRAQVNNDKTLRKWKENFSSGKISTIPSDYKAKLSHKLPLI